MDIDYTKYNGYNTLISPRGARERIHSKRQQFEQMIQGDKDDVKEKLRTMVQPYHKTAKYESFKQAEPQQNTNMIPYPSQFQKSMGSVASNKGSVARFEDQQLGKAPGLDDTFIREEKTLTASASQPIIKSNAMRRYTSPPFDDDDDPQMAQNLKFMYPEPGLKDTFVNGVYTQSLNPGRKQYLSPQNAMEENPYFSMGSTYSQRKMGSVALTRNSMKEATNFGNGHPPSYGRIIGLSRRLDKDVNHKMRFVDNQKQHQDAIKELVDIEKGNSGFNDVKSSYGSHSNGVMPYTQFQKNALNVINNRS